MSIYAKDEGEKREILPAGSHIARCYSMIHFGTFTEEYMGIQKEQNKINVAFEIPNEMRVFNEEKGEQPMVIGKDYTLSMFEKANLRKDLESWRGLAFTEAEAKEFDVTKLLGVPCMLSVIHKVSKNTGNAYAYIASISGIPKGMTCPAQINKTVEFNYDEMFDPVFVEGLPSFLKEKIVRSNEYKARMGELESEEESNKQIAAEESLNVGNDNPPVNDLPF